MKVLHLWHLVPLAETPCLAFSLCSSQAPFNSADTKTRCHSRYCHLCFARQSARQAARQAGSKVVGKAVSETASKAVSKAVGKAVGKAGGKAGSKAVGKAVSEVDSK